MVASTASASLVVATLLLGGQPASASGNAPVTQPDSVTVIAASRYVPVSLVANDTDPDGDLVFFCGTEVDLPPEIWILSYGKKKQEIWASQRAKPGTYTITYYACDDTTSASGTLTLTVLRPLADQVVLKNTSRPGRVRVINRTPDRVRFLWGAYQEKWKDGVVAVGRDKSKVITVRRRSLIWAVLSKPEFGLGITRGIRPPQDGNNLPPGAEPGLEVTSLDGTRWIFRAISFNSRQARSGGVGWS